MDLLSDEPEPEADEVPLVAGLTPFVSVASGVAPLVGGPPLEADDCSAEESLAMRLDILEDEVSIRTNRDIIERKRETYKSKKANWLGLLPNS